MNKNMVEIQRETQHTSNWNIRNSTSTTNIQSIRQNSIQGFSNHRKVSRILHQLQYGRMKIKVMSHVKVKSQPWKAPKPLHPIPKPTEQQHLIATHKRKLSFSAIPFSFLRLSIQNMTWVALHKRVDENACGFWWVFEDIGVSMVQTENVLGKIERWPSWGSGKRGFQRGKRKIRGN